MGPIGCLTGLVAQIIYSAMMIIAFPFIVIGAIIKAIFVGRE